MFGVYILALISCCRDTCHLHVSIQNLGVVCFVEIRDFYGVRYMDLDYHICFMVI